MSNVIQFPVNKKSLLNDIEVFINESVIKSGQSKHMADILSARIRDRFTKYVNHQVELPCNIPFPDHATDIEKEAIRAAVDDLTHDLKKIIETFFIENLLSDFADLESLRYCLEYPK